MSDHEHTPLSDAETLFEFAKIWVPFDSQTKSYNVFVCKICGVVYVDFTTAVIE